MSALVASGHEALVVTGPGAIYWLTGRQTAGCFAFQALILTASGELTLLVRQLELYGTVANTWLSTSSSTRITENCLRRQALRGIPVTGSDQLGKQFLPDIRRRIARSGLAFADGQDMPPLHGKSADELAAIRAAAWVNAEAA